MKPADTRLRATPFAVLALACGSALAAPVEPGLLDQARRDGRVEALLVLPDQARPALAPLDAGADYRLRRRALVDALRARAATQQAGLRAWLDARGIAYRPYWIANLVWVRAGAADLAALAARDDLGRIAANPRLAAHLPRSARAAAADGAVGGIAWGVQKINAPAVWDAGFDGQGVVVGGEDTGYQWDHPALKPHYRGWDGSTAEHAYNWHDAIHDEDGNACGSDAPEPCDDYGHGTHTAGTFAGGDGGANRIGVAPGARWIGCRNMADGVGTPARYVECMQWMLAPTDAAGANPDPDRAPDVVSNSWTCTADEGCTTGAEIAAAVDNLVAGGIFFAAGAANDGPGCGTIAEPPAIYDASFVVGMTDDFDRVNLMSSRGPVAGTATIRPDVVAPGVSICSSVPGNGYSCDWTGTSMATPHVAGAAALLMSVNPALKGRPGQIAELLRASAVTDGVSDPSHPPPGGCGGLTMADWPNYQAGYGRIDVLAAALAAGLGDALFEDGFDGTPAR